jgi:hypothetical protein
VLLVCDGPEKAGKTTFLNEVFTEAEKRGYRPKYRHWGPIPKTLGNGDPGDTRYLPALQEDLQWPGLVVWDRSWASEWAYAPVPGQDDHRLCDDPWLGEWLYGRTAQAVGHRLMLLGPDAETLAKKRTPDDLPIDPAEERDRYLKYGLRFGWHVSENPHTPEALEKLVDWVLDRYEKRIGDEGVGPPAYCGPMDARVVFLGERRNDGTGPQKGYGPPGAWLPFTSRFTEKLGRSLGDMAFSVGWTNVYDVRDLPEDQNPLRNAEMVIACGKTAQGYASTLLGKFVLEIPHPSALYRWGTYDSERPKIEKMVLEAVSRHQSWYSPKTENTSAATN